MDRTLRLTAALGLEPPSGLRQKRLALRVVVGPPTAPRPIIQETEMEPSQSSNSEKSAKDVAVSLPA